MVPSSARRPFGHQPPQGRPRARAASSAPRSAPVWPPETTTIAASLPAVWAIAILRLLPAGADVADTGDGHGLFRGAARERARAAEAAGEVPIGAVIVEGGAVVAAGSNQ